MITNTKFASLITMDYRPEAALAIFIITLFLMIKRPRGISLVWLPWRDKAMRVLAKVPLEEVLGIRARMIKLIAVAQMEVHHS